MDSSKNCTKKSFLDKLKTDKKTQYIAVFLLLAILVVGYIACFAVKNTDGAEGESDYALILEKRLADCVSSIKGVGAVKVAVTLESGKETVLATEKKTVKTSSGTETKETPIIVNGKTVVLKENFPKVSGVLIVAEGAGNIAVMTKIQQATMSLFNIKADRIEILSMN